MKGIVFTEFIEMVEEQFGFETADQIITNAKLPSDGVYTAVGTYDFAEMVSLITGLSSATGVEVPALLHSFGLYLFKRFHVLYPHFFQGESSALPFLYNIENYIHTEVLKLYPDAELPRIQTAWVNDRELEMIYRSSRGLGDLAMGLIEGCALHFGEEIAITKELLSGNGTVVKFNIIKK